MKKIMSAVLALGMFASMFTISASAIDSNETYDSNILTQSFDTAYTTGELSTDNSPDGTKYNTFNDVGDDTSGTNYVEYTAASGRDHIWELDVRFNGDNAGFAINNKSNRVSWVYLRDVDTATQTGNLRMQTGSSGYATKATGVAIGKWYHIVVYGRYTNGFTGGMDMYPYNEDGSLGTKLAGTSWGSRNTHLPNRVYFYNNVSVDNLNIYNMNADHITVNGVTPQTETGADINAGESVTLEAKAYREEFALTAPSITWELYDENNEFPVSPTGVTFDSAKCELQTNTAAQTQNLIIRATANTPGAPSGTYPVSIKYVDPSGLKFDEIAITPSANTITAGGNISFNVEAKKDGAVVTDLAEEDVAWKVYDANRIFENNNKFITFHKTDTGWIMEVAKDKVISQAVKVVAGNSNGTVTDSCDITIKASDMLDADDTGIGDKLMVGMPCEALDNNFTSNTGAGDGSNYYTAKSEYTVHDVGSSSGSTSEDILMESDFMFTANGQGWVCFRGDGSSQGLEISYQDGSLVGPISSSGSAATLATGLELNKWYHVKQLSSSGGTAAYAHIWVYKYEEDGTRTLVNEKMDAGHLRNQTGNAFGRCKIKAGTSFDNFRIAKAIPNGVSISSSKNTALAGDTVTFETNVTKWGMPMKTQTAECLALIDGVPADTQDFALSKSEDGKQHILSIGSLVTDCNLEVRAVILSGLYTDSVIVQVQSSDIFEITGIDLNPTGDRVTRINVTKKVEYTDDATFIIAAYDETGVLLGVTTKPYSGKNLTNGEAGHVPVSFTLPEGFDKEADVLRVFVWTNTNNE